MTAVSTTVMSRLLFMFRSVDAIRTYFQTTADHFRVPDFSAAQA